jgi:hypothetical protein
MIGAYYPHLNFTDCFSTRCNATTWLEDFYAWMRSQNALRATQSIWLVPGTF